MTKFEKWAAGQQKDDMEIDSFLKKQEVIVEENTFLEHSGSESEGSSGPKPETIAKKPEGTSSSGSESEREKPMSSLRRDDSDYESTSQEDEFLNKFYHVNPNQIE